MIPSLVNIYTLSWAASGVNSGWYNPTDWLGFRYPGAGQNDEEGPADVFRQALLPNYLITRPYKTRLDR